MTADEEVVVLGRDVDEKEVIGEETAADVADVRESDPSPDFGRGGINVVDGAI